MRRLATLCVALAAVVAGPVTRAAAQQWAPPPRTNLTVLPMETDARALITAMRGFTQALGVRCQYCHTYKGSDPDDLNAFDFIGDDKPAKNTARTMMRMTRVINEDQLKSVGTPPPAGESKVTCYTCHRGETKPLTRRPQ